MVLTVLFGEKGMNWLELLLLWLLLLASKPVSFNENKTKSLRKEQQEWKIFLLLLVLIFTCNPVPGETGILQFYQTSQTCFHVEL